MRKMSNQPTGVPRPHLPMLGVSAVLLIIWMSSCAAFVSGEDNSTLPLEFSGNAYEFVVSRHGEPNRIVATVYASETEICPPGSNCIQIMRNDSSTLVLDLVKISGPDQVRFSERTEDGVLGTFSAKSSTISGTDVFSLEASDGPSTATATVRFVPNNETTCFTSTLERSVDGIPKYGDVLFTPSCSDPDSQPLFVGITGLYTDYSVWSAGCEESVSTCEFFAVSDTGQVKMVKNFMKPPGNEVLIGLGVSDGLDTVHYNMTLNIESTGVCDVDDLFYPWYKWKANLTIFEIHLNCNKTVLVDIVRPSSFTLMATDDYSVVKLRLNEYIPGHYVVELLLIQGSQIQTLEVGIDVFNPPVFQPPLYATVLSSPVDVGQELLRVNATSDVPGAKFSFSQGYQSDPLRVLPGGHVTVQNALPGNMRSFDIEVAEQISGLKATTTAYISSVGDCNWTAMYITLEWNSAIASLVNQLNCSDADLVYDVSSVSESPDTFVEIDQSGIVRLERRIPSTFGSGSVEIYVTTVSRKMYHYFFILLVTPPRYEKGVETNTLGFLIGDDFLAFGFELYSSLVSSLISAWNLDWISGLIVHCQSPLTEIYKYETDWVTSWDNDKTIVIGNLTPSTTYSDCVIDVMDPDGPYHLTPFFEFTTHGLLRATIQPSDPVILVSLGESLRLQCTLVEGADASLTSFCSDGLSYEWYINLSTDNFIDLGPGETHYVPSVSEEDLGSYTCDVLCRGLLLYGVNGTRVALTGAIYVAQGVEVVTSYTWNPLLLDKSSAAYLVLEQTLISKVDKLLSHRVNYVGCAVVGFSDDQSINPNGTGVVAYIDLREKVEREGDMTDVTDVLGELVQNGALETTMSSSSVEAVSADNVNISQRVLYENYPLNITSDVTVVLNSLLMKEMVDIVWTRNGRTLYEAGAFSFDDPISQENAQSLQQFADGTLYAYTLSAVLSIDSFEKRYLGNFSCFIAIKGSDQDPVLQSIDLGKYTFVETPEVYFAFKSVVVLASQSVNVSVFYRKAERLTCNLTIKGVAGTPTTFQIPPGSRPSGTRTILYNPTGNATVVCKAFLDPLEEESQPLNLIVVKPEKAKLCPRETKGGITWESVPIGLESETVCLPPNVGTVKRLCKDGGVWGSMDFSNCVNEKLLSLDDQIDDMASGVEAIVELAEVGKDMAKALNNTQKTTGDIRKAVDQLVQVGGLADDRGVNDSGVIKEFGLAADELLKVDPDEWQGAQEKEGGNVEQAKLLTALDKLAEGSLKGDDLLTEPLVTENLAIKQGFGGEEGIVFPEASDNFTSSWVETTKSVVVLNKNAIQTNESIKYSIIVYKGALNKFPTDNKLQEKYPEGKNLKDKQVNSDVISIAIYPALTSTLSEPLVVNFEKLENNFSQPDCAFLNTSVKEYGLWSTSGCRSEQLSDGSIRCLCDHLTNFAILMSPTSSSSDHEALNIISIVGCAISILCLVITLAVYFVLWKYVKHDRSVLHVHLSVCLIIGYVTFLAGVERTENEIACTVVAVLLHFVFLAAFSIMLAEGIHLLVSLRLISRERSFIWRLLLLSYGVPLVVVGATLAITQAEDYHSDEFCWLSVDSGTLLAFVGPALAIILMNYIILALVLRTMFTTRRMQEKTARDKAKSVVRAISVLCPVLGLTWVLGVFAVNEDLKVFQYAFAVVNSLQGLLIFIFHVLLCNQVQDGYRAIKRKHRARSFDSGQKLTNTKSQSESETNPRRDRSGSNVPLTPVTDQTFVLPTSFRNDQPQIEQAVPAGGPSHRDDDSSYRDDGPSYRDDGRSYRDDGPSNRVVGPGYRNNDFRDDGPNYGDDGPINRDVGLGYRDADSSYRDAGPSYRDVGPSYRDADPSYRDAGPSYRDVGPSYRDAGPSYREDDPRMDGDYGNTAGRPNNTDDDQGIIAGVPRKKFESSIKRGDGPSIRRDGPMSRRLGFGKRSRSSRKTVQPEEPEVDYDVDDNNQDANEHSYDEIQDNEAAIGRSGSGKYGHYISPPSPVPSSYAKRLSLRERIWRRLSSKRSKGERDLARLKEVYGSDINPVHPEARTLQQQPHRMAFHPKPPKTADRRKWFKSKQSKRPQGRSHQAPSDRQVPLDQLNWAHDSNQFHSLSTVFSQSSREDLLL